MATLREHATIGLFLYGMVTATDAAGNPTKRSNFEFYYTLMREPKSQKVSISVKRVMFSATLPDSNQLYCQLSFSKVETCAVPIALLVRLLQKRIRRLIAFMFNIQPHIWIKAGFDFFALAFHHSSCALNNLNFGHRQG